MDEGHWNMTLRQDIDMADTHSLLRHGAVLDSGLVVLSINRNEFTARGLTAISRCLRKNNWLIGWSLVVGTVVSHCVVLCCSVVLSSLIN